MPMTASYRSSGRVRRHARARSTKRPIRTQRLLEPLVRGRVAHPDVAGARRPEGTPRDDRDALLGQQPLGERLVVEAGRADARERVERAARLERLEPERVEPVDDQPPAAVVLGEHPLDVGLALDDRRQRRVLRRRRRRHDPVLVDLDHPLEDRRRRGHVADAPAGHRVRLREAAHQDRPLAHPVSALIARCR